jgi:hypothetical protein
MNSVTTPKERMTSHTYVDFKPATGMNPNDSTPRVQNLSRNDHRTRVFQEFEQDVVGVRGHVGEVGGGFDGVWQHDFDFGGIRVLFVAQFLGLCCQVKP